MADQGPLAGIAKVSPDPSAPRADDLLGAIATATRELGERKAALLVAQRARDASILRADSTGLVMPEIAEAAGISKQAVHKLLCAQSPRRLAAARRRAAHRRSVV